MQQKKLLQGVTQENFPKMKEKVATPIERTNMYQEKDYFLIATDYEIYPGFY